MDSLRLPFDFESLSTERITILDMESRPWLTEEFRLLELCPADREELAVVNPASTPEETLSFGLGQSNTWGALFDGTPAALFGFAPLPEGGAFIPWLLSDGRIQRALPREFLRITRRIVESVRRTGVPMYNWLPAETSRRTAWLTHLGFAFHTRPFSSPEGKPLRLFYMNTEEKEI